jgi:hypothetical protein
MMNGHDLFPGEIQGSNNTKSVKTAAQLGAEDSIVLAEIQQLASAEAMPIALPFPKSVIAKGIVNRKAAAVTSVAAIAIVAAALSAYFLTQPHGIGSDLIPSVLVSQTLVEPSPVKALSELPETITDLPSIPTDLPETVALPPPPAGADIAVQATADHAKAVDERGAAAVTEPPEIKTLPVKATDIRIVDEPFEGPLPEGDISASSLIDQFGFGSQHPIPVEVQAVAPVEPKTDLAASKPISDNEDVEKAQTIDTSDVENETIPQADITAPVPAPKPATTETSQEVSYRVVDRKGEKSGFWRMRGNDAATKQWFVVVEAADANGKTFSVPVKSADTGVVKEVSKWAIEVTEKDFTALSDQLLKSKVIREPIGKAQSKTSQPKWTVSTTGAMLTEW